MYNDIHIQLIFVLLCILSYPKLQNKYIFFCWIFKVHFLFKFLKPITCYLILKILTCDPRVIPNPNHEYRNMIIVSCEILHLSNSFWICILVLLSHQFWWVYLFDVLAVETCFGVAGMFVASG